MLISDTTWNVKGRKGLQKVNVISKIKSKATPRILRAKTKPELRKTREKINCNSLTDWRMKQKRHANIEN